jgi:hypothetical protein
VAQHLHFLAKELTRANCQFSDWHFRVAEGHVPTNTVYSFLQFRCLKFVVIG